MKCLNVCIIGQAIIVYFAISKGANDKYVFDDLLERTLKYAPQLQKLPNIWVQEYAIPVEYEKEKNSKEKEKIIYTLLLVIFWFEYFLGRLCV